MAEPLIGDTHGRARRGPLTRRRDEPTSHDLAVRCHRQRDLVSHAVVVALLAGGLLRTIQFLWRSSFWYDELAVVLNVQQLSAAELMSRPLEYRQVAPPVFLLAVKAASSLLSPDELGFRTVPWLCALASLFLFWRVARLLLGERGALVATIPFTLSPALVWYAANVKPYAGDVAATLLLVWLTFSLLDGTRDRLRCALVAVAGGAAAVALSFAAAPTAAILAMVLVWRSSSAGARGQLRLVAAAWLGSAAVCGVWAVSLIAPDTRDYMHRYWIDGFPQSVHGAAGWSLARLFAVFAHFTMFDPRELGVAAVGVVALWFVLALAGAVVLLRSDPLHGTVVLAPTLGALAAAAVALLPLQGRVSVYAGWPLLMMAAVALHALSGARHPFWRFAGRSLTVSLIAGPALALVVAPPPYRNEEMRPALAALAAQRQPADAVYAYYGAAPAIRFYGPRFRLNDVHVGSCHRGDPRAYLREVDQFRGRRVWFVFSHGALGFSEPQIIRSYLGAIGQERQAIPDGFGLRGQREAAAYLYDLSEPARLASVTAESFALPAAVGTGTRTLCDGTRLGSGSTLDEPALPIVGGRKP